MTEKELVLCAQAGDVDAFCTLYDRYKRKLYNYAYYKLGNTQDAEDAVQDCMLAAYARLEQLKKAEAFAAWLYAILYHGCMAGIKAQPAGSRQILTHTQTAFLPRKVRTLKVRNCARHWVF